MTNAVHCSAVRISWSARRDGCATISERNSLDTSAFKAIVLDEADEMLDLGFREDLESFLAPPRRNVVR